MSSARKWRDCRGFLPRLIRFFSRRGNRWALAVAGSRLAEEIEDERMGAVLSACFQSGKTVIGAEDEAGQFRLRVLEEE